MKIISTHLLNDFSGSPKVLRQVIETFLQKGYKNQLFVSGGKQGFLTEIKGCKITNYPYTFKKNKFVRLFQVLKSQLILAIKVFFSLKKDDIIYVNTLWPFGAAIMGKLCGHRVIYHLHETSIKPAILKKSLFFILDKTAS